MIINIHSHKLHDKTEEQIISLCFKDNKSELFEKAAYISIGIHPWYITEEELDKQIEWIRHTAQSDKRVLAIGECGTDKICHTPITLQLAAFKSMIKISEELELPLIIHSVKTFNEIISLKKQLKPCQKWIIHGFRGKKEAARQLTDHGIYISIGEKFNPETVKSIPQNMLLLETDESNRNISHIIQSVAQILCTDSIKLIKTITENTNNLFFKR